MDIDFKETISIVIGITGFFGMLIAFWEKIFNSGKKDENISNRVGDLEKNFDSVSKDIKTIKENHLSHIQIDINDIKVNLAGINTTLEFLKDK